MVGNPAVLGGVISQPMGFRSIWTSPAALPLLLACAGTGLVIAVRGGPIKVAASLGAIVSVVGLLDLIANGSNTFVVIGIGTVALAMAELGART